MHNRNTLQVCDALFPTEEELWSLSVVKARTGLSRSSIYAYIAAGNFPAQRHLGRRRVAWLASEVRAWIKSCPRQPTDGAPRQSR
jgi:prophage regulatory protein